MFVQSVVGKLRRTLTAGAVFALAITGFVASGASTTAVSAPITARTVWQAPDSPNDVGRITLAVTTAEGDDVDEAVIVFDWVYDDTAWFPVWKAGVTVQPQPGADPSRIDLTNTRQPQPGHTYAILITYDPRSGTADVQLTDVTADDHWITRTLTLPASMATGHAQAFAAGNRNRPLPTTAIPYFTPMGTAWRLIAESDDGAVSYLTSFDPFALAGWHIRLQLTMPMSLPGRWHVVADDNVIARLPAAKGTHEALLLTVSPDDLGPLGLQLQYVEDDVIVVSHSLPVAAGRIEVAVDQPVLKDDHTAAALVQVASPSRVDFGVTVTARVVAVAWDAQRLRYEQTPLDDFTVTETWPVALPEASAQPVATMHIPVPVEPGTYKISFTVDHNVPVPVAMDVTGQNRAVTVTDARTRFSVVTYNIWGRHEWPVRAASLKAVLRQMNPDIIAFQELKAEHFMTIADALPQHRWVMDAFSGWFNEGNIFWSDDLFELVDYGAEDIGIYETWRRLFWVRLRVKETGDTVVVGNAHYTWGGHARIVAEGGNPRPGMAQATVEALQAIVASGEPVIFVGDLNESGVAIDVLRRSGFIDSVGFTGDGLATTHPSDTSFPSSPSVIDWQLHRGPLQVLDAQVVTFKLNGVVPSDHKPVWVLYGLK